MCECTICKQIVQFARDRHELGQKSLSVHFIYEAKVPRHCHITIESSSWSILRILCGIEDTLNRSVAEGRANVDTTIGIRHHYCCLAECRCTCFTGTLFAAESASVGLAGESRMCILDGASLVTVIARRLATAPTQYINMGPWSFRRTFRHQTILVKSSFKA